MIVLRRMEVLVNSNIYRLLKHIWLWPPYLGAGIHVRTFDKPLNNIVVGMKLRRRNINYVGTHFGGNLYSMCDPWFMFILMNHLGPEFIVWDKSANIDFIKPGKGLVTARFSISLEQIDEIRAAAITGEKVLPTFQTEVIDDETRQVIARVTKILYVRKKQAKVD